LQWICDTTKPDTSHYIIYAYSGYAIDFIIKFLLFFETKHIKKLIELWSKFYDQKYCQYSLFCKLNNSSMLLHRITCFTVSWEIKRAQHNLFHCLFSSCLIAINFNWVALYLLRVISLNVDWHECVGGWDKLLLQLFEFWQFCNFHQALKTVHKWRHAKKLDF